MNIKSLIDELLRLNISLQVVNGELRVAGSRERMTPDIVEKIRKDKQGLIRFLLQTDGRDANESIFLPAAEIRTEAFVPKKALRPMDFSLFYFGNALGEGVRDAEIYKLVIDGAMFADNNGFTAVWVPERHFNEFGGLYPNPSVLAAALAVLTKNVDIRAGSVVLPLHNPIRIAEEWAMIDNLSGGRAGIACACGWQPNDFVFFPEHYGRRQEVMFEILSLVRKLWKGESLFLKDGNGSSREIRIFPCPIQRELPLWITSGGNIATFISAGKLGLNILTHLLGETVEELAIKIEAYRKAYRESGFDERQARITLMLHTFIGEDLAATMEKVRLPLKSYLRSSLGLIRNMAISSGYNLAAENVSSDDVEGMLDFAFKRYTAHSSLIGTVGSCKDMLHRLSDIGVTEVACLIDFGVDYSSVMQSLGHLADLKMTYNYGITDVSNGAENRIFETIDKKGI